MISLTGGNVQNLAGLAQPGGSLTLQLNTDAVVIATPGFVPSAFQQKFPFGTDANLLGSCKIWSNAELNPPGTQYTATFRDANGARIASQIWQFIQTTGQTVDIGTIIPTSPASALAAVPFSNVAANFVFAGPASGSAAFPAFRALVNADLPGVVSFTTLTVTGNASVGGTLGVTGTTTLAAALATSLTTGQIIQPAATAYTIKDNQGGTRYSIPAGGVAQATINNTSLTGASNANTVTGINDQGTTGAITGTGAPAVVYTYTLPASIVATGKRIHVRVVFAHVGANSVSYTLSLNGVAMLTFATSAANPQVIDADILNTGAASGQEYGFFSTNAAFTPFANTTASGFLWTSNQVLQLTQTVAATDSVSGLGWNVSLP